MVTGQRAFEGKSRLSVASAILEKEPTALTTLKPLTPPALEHAIRGCLAKEPEDRWQTARDLSHELKWIAEAGSQAGAPAVAGRRRGTARITWAVAGLLLAALGALGVTYFKSRGRATSAQVVRSRISPPGDTQFLPDGSSGPPAISPDGKLLVSSVSDSQGKVFLWLRSLDDAEEKTLPGTEGGRLPFWSPDGRSIGFFAGSKLKRIDIDGNSLQTLTDSQQGRGGSWSQDGVILFTTTQGSAIYQIPASGGTPKLATELDTSRGEWSHRWPVFLEDGRHFLFFVRGNDRPEINGIYVGSLDSKEHHLVAKSSSGPAFESGGTIVYMRNDTLVAQSFDKEKLATTDEHVALPDRVGFNARTSQAPFSVSRTGMMIYQPAFVGGPYALTWYNRDGKRGDPLDIGNLYGPALSPDGDQAVVPILSPDGFSADLWSFDEWCLVRPIGVIELEREWIGRLVLVHGLPDVTLNG
jgi:eukaryotic-like serine/threonine-protein kinase